MKIYYVFILLMIIEVAKLPAHEYANESNELNELNESNEDNLNIVENTDGADINKLKSDPLDGIDFAKDIEELDLSGMEDDIENIEEIAHKGSYIYITQIYIYIRVDGEYKKYLNHLDLMNLGQKYMTLLLNAMMEVQLKVNGKGIFACFYTNKDITEDLSTYFLIQKEIDFIIVGFDKRFPEGRNSPIVDDEQRKHMNNINDEL